MWVCLLWIWVTEGGLQTIQLQPAVLALSHQQTAAGNYQLGVTDVLTAILSFADVNLKAIYWIHPYGNTKARGQQASAVSVPFYAHGPLRRQLTGRRKQHPEKAAQGLSSLEDTVSVLG